MNLLSFAKHRRQLPDERGLSLIEAGLALALFAILIAGALGIGVRVEQKVKEREAAQQMSAVADGLSAYLQSNQSSLANGVATVSLSALTSGGYLPAAVTANTAFARQLVLLSRKQNGNVDGMVVATGSNTLKDEVTGAIAGFIGSRGGFLASTHHVGKIQGSSGAWQMDASAWCWSQSSCPQAGDAVAWVTVPSIPVPSVSNLQILGTSARYAAQTVTDTWKPMYDTDTLQFKWDSSNADAVRFELRISGQSQDLVDKDVAYGEFTVNAQSAWLDKSLQVTLTPFTGGTKGIPVTKTFAVKFRNGTPYETVAVTIRTVAVRNDTGQVVDQCADPSSGYSTSRVNYISDASVKPLNGVGATGAHYLRSPGLRVVYGAGAFDSEAGHNITRLVPDMRADDVTIHWDSPAQAVGVGDGYYSSLPCADTSSASLEFGVKYSQGDGIRGCSTTLDSKNGHAAQSQVTCAP